MSSPFVIIETADLQWLNDLPYSSRFDDVYFAKHNGLAEKQQVFIEANQFSHRWRQLTAGASFTIGETGFGTGLNFLLTWQNWLEYAPRDAKLYYYSCEKFPLKPEDLQRALNLWPPLHRYAQQLIVQYPVLTPGFHRLSFDTGRVNLILMLGDAQDSLDELIISGDQQLDQQLNNIKMDAWYLDGFSPHKNQQLWTEHLLATIARLSHAETSLATYSAAALVKQGLQACGFKVKKIPGYGSKRHRLVAQFGGTIPNRRQQITPWHCSVIKPSTTKHAFIIGAGLAGCFTARALADKGWRVTVLEGQQIAAGASGNEQAVLYPNLSAYASPLTRFMLTAFLYAQSFYRTIIGQQVEGQLQGILQLAHNAKEQASQQAMFDWLSAYPDLGQLINSSKASAIAGINLIQEGLWMPLAGWINSKQLCHYLLEHQAIELITNTTVTHLKLCNQQWQVAGQQAEHVVIANGHQANQFSQTNYLPLKPIRGQTSVLAANSSSIQLKIPLCGAGHILPAHNRIHSLGASYGLGEIDLKSRTEDDLFNLNQVQKSSPELNFNSSALISNWTGVRAATPDYLPLVGAVTPADDFLSRFAPLAPNAKRMIARPAQAYPGLYVCAGFGSRGLTTAPLCAQWLASLINCEPQWLPTAMIRSLSPSRFLFREIIRS